MALVQQDKLFQKDLIHHVDIQLIRYQFDFEK